MNAALDEVVKWRFAKHMPQIDNDLKALVVVPFDVSSFRRLGFLQATQL